MARIVSLEEARQLRGQLRDWAYNALDVTGTLEIANVLLPRLDRTTGRTYGWERALQAPALAMARRGVLVDDVARQKARSELKKELRAKEREVAQMPLVKDLWDGRELETGMCPVEPEKHHLWPRGIDNDDPAKVCKRCGAKRWKPKPFEPGSHHQVRHLIYDLHGKPPQRNKKGDVSVDDDVLDRIGRKWPKLLPLTDAIREVRDLVKQVGWMGARLDGGRFPSSFNVGAAWTGRFSSSMIMGKGGNLQNVAERHRHMFIADPGMEMFYADLKQAESLTVAYLAGDEGYIEAHKSGDTHTFVTRLLWPELPWTGDIKKDKVIAKQNPEWDLAPGHNYRFQAKRVQHGGNYGLTYKGMARIAHIPEVEALKAQRRYFEAFPGIRVWQAAKREQIKKVRPLTNPLGRRTSLFGRPWDEHTYKQGLSFEPQSLVADALDLAMIRLWWEHDPELIWLLAQVHDAVLGEAPDGERDAMIAAIIEAMTIPIPVLGVDGKERTMVIPVEIAAGKNWGHQSDDNPSGLVEVY